jgi:hypothetical protein
VLAGVAFAQHSLPSGLPASNGPERFAVQTFGVFRDLMLRGDFGAKAMLGEVMSHSPSTGVGAVSGARGEITIDDGKLIVSYGKSNTHPAPHAETAALLATAKVKEWQTVRVVADVAPAALEAFLAQTA